MNGEAPLAHEDAIGLLDALRDGELAADEAARVEAHVESCERCRAVEAALGGGLKKAVQGSFRDPPSGAPDLLPGVQRRLHLRSRGRFYGRAEGSALSPWPVLIASIALLFALAVGYLALAQMGSPTSIAPAPSGSGR